MFYNIFFGIVFAGWLYFKVDDYLTYKIEEFFRFND